MATINSNVIVAFYKTGTEKGENKMAINLKALQPHKISRDLSGYITYIYGPGGAGKTTFGVQAEKPLLLAFEKGRQLNV